MVKSLKKFFNLIKFEVIKLYRNPFLFAFIIIFPFIITCLFMFIIQSVTSATPAEKAGKDISSDVICFASNKTVDESIKNSFNEFFDTDDINWIIDSKEAKIEQLERGDFIILIYVDDQAEHKISAYYNSVDFYDSSFANKLKTIQTAYEFNYLKSYLAGYGITFNEEFFNLATFIGTYPDDDNINTKRMLPILLCFVLGLLIVCSISFSFTKENETGLIKHLSFTPININEYLISKLLLYSFIGIIQSFIFFATVSIFSMPFTISVLGCMGISLLYVFALICFMYLVSLSKNQALTIGVVMITILIPLLLLIMVDFNMLSSLWAVVLCLSPAVPFSYLIKSYYFYGVINYTWLIVLVAQILCYYLLTYFILKHKTKIKKQNFNFENCKSIT